LLVIGGLGSAALHPIGTTTNASGLFTAGGMVGFALGPVVILHVVSAYGLRRRFGSRCRGSSSAPL
jgi:FSR family fosmidomycin resistance protein-like MFS transporter